MDGHLIIEVPDHGLATFLIRQYFLQISASGPIALKRKAESKLTHKKKGFCVPFFFFFSDQINLLVRSVQSLQGL